MNLNLDVLKTAVLSLHMINDVVTKNGKFGAIFGDEVIARNVIEKGKQLLSIARSRKIPVIHVAVQFRPDYSNMVANCALLSMVQQMNALVEGTWGADFVEGLQPEQNERVILHQRVCPFEGTELDSLLRDLGIESVVLFGVATNIVVESTARRATDLGYNVYVVEDCCSAATLAAHQASVETLGLLANIVSLNDLTDLRI